MSLESFSGSELIFVEDLQLSRVVFSVYLYRFCLLLDLIFVGFQFDFKTLYCVGLVKSVVCRIY